MALFSGVLEYVHDLARLVVFLSQNFRTVVCSYAVGADSSDEVALRRYSGWFNDLREEDFLKLLRGAGYRLTQHGEWKGQKLFRWDRMQMTGKARHAA